MLRYKHVCTGSYVIKADTKLRLEILHHPSVVKHVTHMLVEIKHGCVTDVSNSSLERIHQENN